MKQTQVDFFNKWAKNYLLNKIPQYQNLLNTIFTEVDTYTDPNKVEMVLDLGTGTGICSLISYDKFKNAKLITALDVSQEMINEVEKRWKDNNLDIKKLKTIISDFEDLNLPENTYDLVIASFSLHHIPHNKKAQVLKNIYKVMSKNSTLAIGETMFESQGSKLKIAWIYTKKAINGLIHVGFAQFIREIDFYFKIINKEGEYMATKQMWVECLKEAGFKICKAEYTNKHLTYGMLIAQK